MQNKRHRVIKIKGSITKVLRKAHSIHKRHKHSKMMRIKVQIKIRKNMRVVKLFLRKLNKQKRNLSKLLRRKIKK